MRQTTRIWAVAGLLALTTTGLTMPTQAQNVSELAGYSTLSVSQEFEKFLTENPNIKRRLQENEDLSRGLLSDRSLQARLLSGDVTFYEMQREILADTSEESDISQGSPHGYSTTRRNGSSGRAQANLWRAIAAFSEDEPTDTTQEMMDIAEMRQAALEGLILRLSQEDPEALAEFMQDTQLQQDILDGAVTIADAFAQFDIELSEEEEQAFSTDTDAVYEGGDVTSESPPSSEEYEPTLSGTTPPPYAGPSPVNMNRRPTVAETELGANGWPKYLNVPEDCPAPRNTVQYIHEFRKGPHGIHTPLKTGWSKDQRMGLMHNSYFKTSNWYYLMLDDTGESHEEIAAPLLTPNREVGVNQDQTTPGNAGNTQMVVNIAYCPGDFTNFTPNGKKPIGNTSKVSHWSQGNTCSNVSKYKPSGKNKFSILADTVRVEVRSSGKGSSDHTGSTCVLAPKERYFVNVTPLRKHREMLHENGLDNELLPMTESDGLGKQPPITWSATRTTGGRRGDMLSSIYSSPPYAGPCVEGPAFPPNYSGPLTDEYPYTSGYTCGSRVETRQVDQCGVGGSTHSNLEHERIWKCYDPEDILPPQTFRYTSSCSGKTQTKTWTDGYGEPAYHAYVCEHFYSDEELASDSPVQGRKVCAAHRDGDVRTKRFYHSGIGGYHPEIIEQCQFDRAQGRYDWVAIDQTDYYKPDVRYKITREAGAPPYDDKCRLDNKTYPIGTKVSVTCPSMTNARGSIDEVLYCEQRADEPALPRFVLQPGLQNMTQANMGFRFSKCKVSVID